MRNLQRLKQQVKQAKRKSGNLSWTKRLDFLGDFNTDLSKIQKQIDARKRVAQKLTKKKKEMP